jgi:SOS-response transcriptional repressor LexA
MDLATRLKAIFDQRGLKQTRVAELAGIPDETLSRIVTGATKHPGVDTLAKIADALGETVGWILQEKGYEFSSEDRAELRRFMDWGEGILKATLADRKDLQPPNASPRRGREVEIPAQFAEQGATLIFNAEGESMLGEHIAHGDLLYVREESDPRLARGRIVVCVVSGTPYVKRLELTGRKIRLVSANERFAPMVFNEEVVEWTLVGVVVGWSHDAR